MRSFFSLVPGQESKVSVFQNVEFFLYCYFPILLVLYSKLAGKTVYQSSASIEHASQLCKQKNKKKKRHISIFLSSIIYFNIFYESWLFVWCNDMFVYWVCRGLCYGFGGSEQRGMPSHMETCKIKQNTGGENIFVLFFLFFFFSFLNQCKFILGGDRQGQELQHWLSRVKKKTHTHTSVFVLFPPFFRSGSQCAIVCYQSLLCNQTMSLLSLWSVYSRCEPRYDNTDLVTEEVPHCMLVARLRLC